VTTLKSTSFDTMQISLPKVKKALEIYFMAEREIRAAGFSWEIEWQNNRNFTQFSEQEFLRETAWVILCSGFREASVRKRFDYISLCFCDWESASEITNNRSTCVATAISGFKNHRKINAIADVASIVHDQGFEALRVDIQKAPIERLTRLPFIGSITSWHLAKNLGFNVAKNDRHLARIADSCGYEDAQALCTAISVKTGVATSTVDIVLWRHAVLQRRTLYS
jgi:hypothetical protein